MQCLATFRLLTSPLHRHCYSSQQDELRARPVRTRIAGQVRVRAMQAGQTRSCGGLRIAGQVRVRAMQAGQTRSCGARAHTHKHPRTGTPAVVSHATCAAALPSGSPPPPSQLSFGQLKIVNRPTPQTSALFSGPHRRNKHTHEQYLSDPWAPGHAVLCVWKPERRSFTHSKCHARLLSVRFSGANRRVQDHSCGG